MNDSALCKALSLLPVGLHVVTAYADGQPVGLLCGWVMPASWDPPLLVAAVGQRRHTHDFIVRRGAFAVNLLRPEQLPLARQFGLSSGRDVDKFASHPWYSGVTGSPILEGSAGYLDCRVVDRFQAGDHTLFLGDILDARAFSDACLLYRRDQHQGLFGR